MTDAELDAYLSGSVSQKRPEDMTDDELDAYLAGGTPAPQGQPLQTEILEAPADLSGRFAMKTFGTDVGSKIKYYQEQNKDKDIMENPYNKGEIIARVKGTSKWLKEDPGIGAWLEYPSEMVRDITDLADLYVAAPVSVAATTAGGLAGLPAGPLGSYAGAVGAGTAAQTGLEAARQGIGSALFGQKFTLEPSDVGTTAAINAALLPLTGIGASQGQIAKKLGESPNLVRQLLESSSKTFVPKGKDLTKGQLEEAGSYLGDTLLQKGGISKVSENILPMFFGGTKEQLQTATKPVSKSILIDLTNLEKNPDALLLDPAKKYSQRELVQAATQQGKIDILGKTALENITEAAENAKNSLKERYESAYSQIRDTFNVNKFAGPIKNRLEEIKKDPSIAAVGEEQKLKQILSENFTPKPVTVTETKMVRQQIPGYLDLAGNPLVKDVPTQVQRQVPGSPNWDVGSIKALSSRLKEEADISASFAQLQGKPVTTRRDRGAILEAASMIDNAVKAKLPDKNLPGDYAKNMQITKTIMKNFGTPDKAASSIANAMNESAKQKKILGDLKTFDKMNNTNLVELAEIAQTSKRFGDPSLEQIGGPGITSTSRTLRAEGLFGAVGNLLGKYLLPEGGQIAGQAVGRAAGGLTATNATLNKILAAKEAMAASPFGKVSDLNVSPYARSTVPWLYLQQAKEEQNK